jgi:hypothetical protein
LNAAHTERAGMERIIDQYLDALVAGDPKGVPLSEAVVFAENDQRLPLGTAGWKTISAQGSYRHVFCDFETHEVGVIANVSESGLGAVLVARLKLRDAHIVEIEQFMIRDPGAYDRYEALGAPEPIWLEAIPAPARQSREALEAVSWMYFQTLERNDGAGIYPFTDDCDRLELGRQSVARPSNESYGHADSSVEFTTLKARQQYALGMMGYINCVRDRRVLVVDAERGAVLGSALFDMDGMTKKIDLTGGGVFEVPAYFRTPRTHHMNEAFKVVNGSFRYVEMTFFEVPYGTRPVWSKPPTAVRTDLRFAPPAVPVRLDNRAALIGLVEKFLDALIRCCPCELPLAAEVTYTENGVRVPLGDGLWKSVSGRGTFQLHLADPESGQAGFVGSLDENGFFAMIVARLKAVAGLITEIEIIVARPERTEEWGNLGHATHTLFVPPLLADLRPSAFADPPEQFASAPPRRPSSRAELLQVVERYFTALAAKRAADAPLAKGFTRRENGIEASGGTAASQIDAGYIATLMSVRRRPLVVDERAGLVLDLALFDIAGTSEPIEVQGVGKVAVPAAFLTPSTDLHAQLFSIDAGQIQAIEDIVRRVPYGQSGPWDPPARP